MLTVCVKTVAARLLALMPFTMQTAVIDRGRVSPQLGLLGVYISFRRRDEQLAAWRATIADVREHGTTPEPPQGSLFSMNP